MKYIIEIEEAPFFNDNGLLWRAKGFNSLVFDKNGLDRLEPYNPGAVKKGETLIPGDEIEWDDGTRSVILSVSGNEYCELRENGEVTFNIIPDSGPIYHKTGRHYDELSKMMQKIRAGE